MLRHSDIVEVVALGAVVMALGFALCFVAFTFLPLWFAAGLVGCFLLVFVTCAGVRLRPSAVLYGVIGVIYTLIFAWAIHTHTGVTRLEQCDCNWKLLDGGVEVDLGDGWGFERIQSAELTTYLKEQQPRKVQVVIPVTRDFGKARCCGKVESVNGIRVNVPIWVIAS